MSYANVAAAHPPPPSLQGKPDPALLNTHPSHSYTLVDSTNEKVVVAPPDFKSHPKTVTSEFVPPPSTSTSGSAASRKDKAKRAYGRAEHEAETLWFRAKNQLLRPGVAGGLLGLVNVGLLATASYSFYTDPALRRDRRAIGGTVVGALVLLGAEGWLAESYAKTEAGQREAQKAREEGAYVYRRAHDIVLRPGVFGGLLGALNVGILGTIGYVFYSRPELRDDRRLIAGITTGVLTVFAGEGYLFEKEFNQ
ncbi:hypothetical protein BKA62DRAFT_710530 [Auriculariales sp. MPI-PUGE-AT-0066]|nr:hypothetical protein BKA62DRAFT_710530 [Auriculariales sp. MPI-PUGE-AT-0066]